MEKNPHMSKPLMHDIVERYTVSTCKQSKDMFETMVLEEDKSIKKQLIRSSWKPLYWCEYKTLDSAKRGHVLMKKFISNLCQKVEKQHDRIVETDHFNDRKSFMEYMKNTRIAPKNKIIVGDFKNEYGEEYIVYAMNALPNIFFVTGDELDWESGWTIDPLSKNIVHQFITNDDEKKALLNIVNQFREKLSK